MRIDVFLSEKFASRTKSREKIEAGFVLVNGNPVKPNYELKETDIITFLEQKEEFVSNGGYKLSKAIRDFSYSVQDKIFIDIGASTGGFTDCLLQNGAKKVYAVDVGESLLHDKLRGDNRVVPKENVNARYMNKTLFSDIPNGVVADVSFISLTYILPVIYNLLGETGDALLLIKPQFECEGKHNIGKSGIVKLDAHPNILKKIFLSANQNGFSIRDLTYAPIRKNKNVEYVIWLQKDTSPNNNIVGMMKKSNDLIKSIRNQMRCK